MKQHMIILATLLGIGCLASASPALAGGGRHHGYTENFAVQVAYAQPYFGFAFQTHSIGGRPGPVCSGRHRGRHHHKYKSRGHKHHGRGYAHRGRGYAHHGRGYRQHGYGNDHDRPSHKGSGTGHNRN